MISSLTDGMKLYHGSYCEVKTPNLKRCSKYKDFGQGLYVTTSYEQAKQFAKISTRKAVENGVVPVEQDHGVVSIYSYINKADIDVKLYEYANEEWLHCIVAHRKEHTFEGLVDELSNYDVICGKIANDATNATILAYMAGTFGAIGSKEADEICIRLLLPERLQDQYAFRTNRALGNLSFDGSKKIWM